MLQSLVEYAHKNLADSEPGFTTRSIRWLVDVSAEGQLINVLPVGDDKGEQTSKCPDMHNMNAGGRAHFMVETLQTISLFCKAIEDPKKVAASGEKHQFLKEMICKSSETIPALLPLAGFMKNGEEIEKLRDRFALEKAKPTDWMKWRIAGADPLQQPEVLEWWRGWRDADQSKGEGGREAQKG